MPSAGRGAEEGRSNDEALVLGAHHDRRAVRQLHEQLARVVKHSLDLAVGPREELLHLLLLLWHEWERSGEVIDEEAVALVRRHPAGRRVGVGEVAVALECGHVRPDGSWRYVDGRVARHLRRADRLGGLDVPGDDRL